MLKVFGCLIDLLLVPKCAGCGQRMNRRGNTLCKACLERYNEAKEEYCDFCGLQATLCSCVPHLLWAQGCGDYRKLAFYKTGGEFNALGNMLYSIKKRYNTDLMRFFMQELASLAADEPSRSIVTFIPRSRTAKREYGYDQGKLLAKFYAEITDNEFTKMFRHTFFHRQKEQKLLNFNQRAKNIRGAYRLCNAKRICGKNIILVDDVVTSGATVGECTSMLYAAGAKSVSVRSIAHTYRKNKQKKD